MEAKERKKKKQRENENCMIVITIFAYELDAVNAVWITNTTHL